MEPSPKQYTVSQHSNTKKPLPPLEKGDYYLENGLMVLTSQYHLKRGWCCKSGCRHCPYGFKK